MSFRPSEEILGSLSSATYDPETAKKNHLKGENFDEDEDDIWEVDHKNSTGERMVATHKKTGHTVVAMRGTQNKKDIKNDLLIAFGLHRKSNRHKRDQKFVEDLVKEKGAANITLTGHSLGGKIAKDVAQDTGVNSHSFNPGAGLGELNVFSTKGKPKKPRKSIGAAVKRIKNPSAQQPTHTITRNKYDLVSAVGTLGNDRKGTRNISNTKNPFKQLSAHTSDQFDQAQRVTPPQDIPK